MDIMDRDHNQESRFRARWIVPAATTAVAPFILAVTFSTLASPNLFDPFVITFRNWLWLSLWMAPTLFGAAVWQVRILTVGPPLHERALTGLCAIFGIFGTVLSLAITLAAGVIFALILFILQYGLPPEVALVFMLRFLLFACAVFLLCAPYCMVAGGLLGLVEAAAIHYSYGSVRSCPAPRASFPVGVAAALALVFWRYAVCAEPPSVSPTTHPSMHQVINIHPYTHTMSPETLAGTRT
jgi:hypothetical protein